MRQTVLGVYDSYAGACAVQRALGEAGLTPADIAIYSISSEVRLEKGPRVYTPGVGAGNPRKPVFDRMDRLFVRLFPNGQYPPEIEHYREFVRRGGSIISVDVLEAQVELVLELMRRAGAADIEERANGWRDHPTPAHGSEPASRPRGPTARDEAGLHAPHAAQPNGAWGTNAQAAGSTPSPGATRERPGAPSAASAPAPDARFNPSAKAGAAEGNEKRGTASSAAPPNATGGTQPGMTRPEGGAAAASKAERRPSTGFAGDPGLHSPMDDNPPYDREFREDYDAHYAKTGTPYDEYRRAYTHGASLGQDEQFRGFDWQKVEPSARQNWESRYPESGWERFKAAVRHGWERVTGG